MDAYQSFLKKTGIFLFLILLWFVTMPSNAAEKSDSPEQSGSDETKSYRSSAVWISASLGMGRAFDMDKDDKYDGGLLYLDMSAHRL